MVVHTQDRQSGYSGVIGLHIGAANAELFFPRDEMFVELELDHLSIVCPLEPSFWQDQPEIHDSRLSSWLESKRNSGKLGTQSTPVTLVPCGRRTFRLQLMARQETLPSDYSVLKPPSITDTIEVDGAIVRVTPRRIGLRKVARLKRNESTSPPANY